MTVTSTSMSESCKVLRAAHVNKGLVSASNCFHGCYYLQDSVLDTKLTRTKKTCDPQLMSFDLIKGMWHWKKYEEVCRWFLLIPFIQHCVWYMVNIQHVFKELVDPLNKTFSLWKIWFLCHLFPFLSRKNLKIRYQKACLTCLTSILCYWLKHLCLWVCIYIYVI